MLTKQLLRLLSIEDNPDHADLLAATLRSIPGYEVQLRHVTCWEEAEPHLREGGLDVVLLDYQLGMVTGLNVLGWMRERGYDTPVIVLTSHTDAYLAAQLTRAGCDHFLIKSDLTAAKLAPMLAEAMDHAARRRDDRHTRRRVDVLENFVTRLVETNAALAIDARHDELTGLLNRRAWVYAARQEHATAQRNGAAYALMMIDADRFKDYNDTFGHLAGDQCLRGIGQALGRGTRGDDLCARYGGEEFILLCPRTTPDAATALAEQLRKEAARAADPPTTVSIGLAMMGAAGPLEDTIERADRALYRAKHTGRNRVCADEPLTLFTI